MGSVLVAGARTPIGKLSGGLAPLSAAELGAVAIKGALERAGVAPDAVDYVIMGQVLQAGAGQLPARQAARLAGIPMSVPATTINKVCLSGLNAIHLADQMIRDGDAEIVVAGGMESMTNAPYLLAGARGGYRYGNGELVDAIVHDGLFCALEHELMGEGAERYAASASIDRHSQDLVSVRSHERAAAAADSGAHGAEIVPVSVAQRRGEPTLVTADEGVRRGMHIDTLAGLRAAFSDSGNVTAGNSSQLSDGACATIIADAAAAERLGLEPLAEIVSYGQVAGPDTSLLTQPSRAVIAAARRADLSVGDLSLFEINEAFAAVVVASKGDLGVSDDIVNVNGGAIALGHPIGASGNRLALTLALELRRRGGGFGAAALCGGGGQGDALILRVR